MASPLVETKLYAPKLRRSLVARPRLSGRLRRGAESRLTLISAPAGFGKTTLLAEWLAASGPERSVAWLSLDESDRQPASYWAYVVTALQAAVPGAGTTALPLLQTAQPPDRDRPHHRAQRARYRAGRRLPGAGRLPPGRQPRHPGRHDVPARAPPAAGAPGGQHPRRPCPAPGPPARRRRAGRGPGRRPALHPRGGGRLPERRRRAR